MGSPAQGIHGPFGMSPEEGHENGQRAGTPLLWVKCWRGGVVQPREENDLNVAFSIYKEGL